MRHSSRNRIAAGSILLAFTLAAGCGPAPASPTPTAARSATISEFANRVEIRSAEGAGWAVAVEGDTLASGGQVQTYESSSARLDVDDGTVVRLAPLSLFTFRGLEGDGASPATRLTLAIGKVFVVLGEDYTGTFTVETVVGNAAVRGSVMSVQFDPFARAVTVACLTGHCSISDLAGNVQELTDNEESDIPSPGAPPSLPRPVSPTNLLDFAQLPEAVTVIATLEPVIGPLPDPEPLATSVLPTPGAAGQPNPEVTQISPADLLAITPTLAPATPTPIDPSTPPPASVHVTVPPLGCSGADCQQYCGSGSGDGPPGPGTPFPTPNPNMAECQAFIQALEAQGVDTAAFRSCVLAGGDFQTCADSNVRPGP